MIEKRFSFPIVTAYLTSCEESTLGRRTSTICSETKNTALRGPLRVVIAPSHLGKRHSLCLASLN